MVIPRAVERRADLPHTAEYLPRARAAEQLPRAAEQLPRAAEQLPRAERAGWLSRYVGVLLVADAVALLLAGLLTYAPQFDGVRGGPGPASDNLLTLAVPAWLLTLAATGCYEGRHLGLGSEEFRRVTNAAAHFTAVIALAVYFFRWDVSRGAVVLTLPVAAVLALGFRYLARQALHRIRRAGLAGHRVLVVGDGALRDTLADRLRAARYSGLNVVGSCRPLSDGPDVAAAVDRVRSRVAELRADTVAVAPSAQITPAVLRRLAWALEGSGVDLLVAPALTDVAGPRVNVRPVSGLPLLQIAEPEFTGMRRLVKGALDLTGAALLLTLLAPLFAALALLVRLTSPGPVLFRQTRIGRGGHPFTIYKFRTMHPDAEQRLTELRALNDHGATGILFKLKDDPRITSIGRVLRRYSLDELPQLLNVLLGQMSLVGPRPPLPTEVAQYERDTHRRLLVKPGITGLWQVSGRSDLDWDETVRLDLYYVENWSVALDAEIAWKTIWAVLKGAGAR
jgi:exopolysaccharide biosynthesis polyprenyl glycosylphosphotransferase